MFKPMLASRVGKLEDLKFPLMASYKLDGIRATVQSGQLMSRSLKPIPNRAVQRAFAGLPDGLDGELILGEPTAKDAFRETTSRVMADDKPADGVVFYVFDRFSSGGFRVRYSQLFNVEKKVKYLRAVLNSKIVPHTLIYSVEELKAFEQNAIEQGYEGVMVRSLGGPYKQGRSTLKEGYLLKIKRFEDGEAEIVGFDELMRNENEATTNELGRTERSTARAGLVPAGVLGKFIVRDLKTGVEFGVGTGYNAADRKQFWENRNKLIGKVIKYKYFLTGSKDKPRFPIFKGFRDGKDM